MPPFQIKATLVFLGVGWGRGNAPPQPCSRLACERSTVVSPRRRDSQMQATERMTGGKWELAVPSLSTLFRTWPTQSHALFIRSKARSAASVRRFSRPICSSGVEMVDRIRDQQPVGPWLSAHATDTLLPSGLRAKGPPTGVPH